MPLPLKTYTDEKGIVWKPYSVELENADGKFSVTMYAISDYHIAIMECDLRETAFANGEIIGVIR